MKTPVAVLRNLLGMKTKDFAVLTGLGVSTVEKLETGRLKLSEQVAFQIGFETGVSDKWLLAGDPSVPPPAGDGKPFTGDSFNAARSEIEQWGKAPKKVEDVFLDWFVSLQAIELKYIATSANKNGQFPMFLHAVHSMILELDDRFGHGDFEPDRLHDFSNSRLRAFFKTAKNHKDRATERRVRFLRNACIELHAELMKKAEEKFELADQILNWKPDAVSKPKRRHPVP